MNQIKIITYKKPQSKSTKCYLSINIKDPTIFCHRYFFNKEQALSRAKQLLAKSHLSEELRSNLLSNIEYSEI